MIRLAVENDLPVILEIYNDAILNTTSVYTYNAQTLEDRKLWFDKKNEDQFPILVFEENNSVLGFATFGPFRAWPAYKYTIEHSVYVHSGYWNHGVGSALLKEIINLAGERNFATLVAGIDSSNNSSLKMHQKFGFEYSGTIQRAGYKFGKWLDLVFYQKNLLGPENPIDG
ncbi:N-acetyltransferase family protein [Desulfosporosinus fructosivorans]|uniref:N-acetyltransferase family protein n=1 Tax=Desulfosporosinus fructosivorans TaxID=2018669 RepID=A0A4Z0R7S1_9FIRM|nr:GNAT family N-acetyltransferase [Desulfosporosinus fructosivorans]TGE38584.1 N-acetyltransferase family protein [Desulfosporosinus fructosivorans]